MISQQDRCIFLYSFDLLFTAILHRNEETPWNNCCRHLPLGVKPLAEGNTRQVYIKNEKCLLLSKYTAISICYDQSPVHKFVLRLERSLLLLERMTKDMN
jgi:hypothetical protein